MAGVDLEDVEGGGTVDRSPLLTRMSTGDLGVESSYGTASQGANGATAKVSPTAGSPISSTATAISNAIGSISGGRFPWASKAQTTSHRHASCESNSWRMVPRTKVFNQSRGGMRIRRLNRVRALYWADIFHTLVDAPMIYVLILFVGGYLLTILFFALIYMAISSRCHLGTSTLRASWAFSLETIMTIGYAYPNNQDYFKQCTPLLVTVTFESIAGIIWDSLSIGLVFQRLSRAQTRASTVVFSDFAVVRRVRGKLRLMFQVAEMRKHQLVEAHVRLYTISRKQCGSDQQQYFKTDAMRLSKPDDELGGMLLMAMPSVIVHNIDAWSPLIDRTLNADMIAEGGEHDQSSSYRFPDVLQRECDAENGNRDRKRPVEPALDPESEEEMIKRHLVNNKVEIMVVVEGIDAVTSDTIQVRYSYCFDDILWHHDFVPCTQEGPDGVAEIDFSKFHKVFPTPSGFRDTEPLVIFSDP
mmetsp:Transcript_19972/g.32928  ORF Transcript_19972/g.32928 Transcript_19972/m.32928 type:complete len:472 (+) Transcript_19972:263-1678(+)|eukprot:CAMPEP_0203766694 /NCGR_PEP_ID=MMETSP0099_2-20121227/565_1 /ASSEMBLY_ACC=CAM_ASM_000209 /TAXON_ID=96639 /ORGANISM=" , Strain NY0313808BC1" /LENGTH=471 /DNA_ID=CAMNT_0050663083 /DNA_START=181 /DNA_END=1596 /DNA_ORIENTATION=-